MTWIILELLVASFAMGMWTSNLMCKQSIMGFIWVGVLIIILNNLANKL